MSQTIVIVATGCSTKMSGDMSLSTGSCGGQKGQSQLSCIAGVGASREKGVGLISERFTYFVVLLRDHFVPALLRRRRFETTRKHTQNKNTIPAYASETNGEKKDTTLKKTQAIIQQQQPRAAETITANNHEQRTTLNKRVDPIYPSPRRSKSSTLSS